VTDLKPHTTLAIFAKPPVPGAVKTRLAARIGDEAAALLAKAFVEDTYEAVAQLGFRVVFASTSEAPIEGFEAVEHWDQGEGHLGRRMTRILGRALENSEVAIGIGSDSPGCPTQRICDAAERLESGVADVVLVPATDGGYTLIGLRACTPELLDGIEWSSPRTLEQTVARLEAQGLEVVLLEPWFDIDELPDLVRFMSAVESRPAVAPRSAAAIETLKRRGLVVPTLSVVLPVLNEVTRIGPQLERLKATPGIDELVVVDGGSDDGTLVVVEPYVQPRLMAAQPSVLLLRCEAGRARQMNAGAAAASGTVLLFLHADVELPHDTIRWVDEALAEPNVVAGAFRTWTLDDDGKRRRPWLHLADLRSRTTSQPYGDQAIFLPRSRFESLGGFADLELMEDLEFTRRLSKLGELRVVPACVTVSGRRFIARPVWYTLCVNTFPLLYNLGVSPRVLGRIYRAVR